MTRVALLWHMHQPFYQDLVTGEHMLPWVRLHALKDYWGMVALLREFPGVRVTFNLVPSLLVQLDAYARDEAVDRHLALGLKDAGTLSEDERAFCLDQFFHAHGLRMIDPYPRYAELRALRGDNGGAGRRAATAFSPDEIRDLQVWHKLAWIDPEYLAGDERARALVDKGRGFTEEDKLTLREIELELLRRVVPEYRAAVERGQVEISTSPFYHPILPLLCDTDVYLRTHPTSRMPRQRFQYPEDAFEQLTRAVDLHERLFGRRPTGLWPSEGSVSDDMVPLVARAGFAWMATDEEILARTTGKAFSRDGGGQVDRPEALYQAYRVGTGKASVACGFRDHQLSDLIGFTYASWGSDDAAANFVERIAAAGARNTARTGGGDGVVFVILDGENAWEHYEGQGRPFLRALYRRLGEHPDLQTVTMAEACAEPAGEMPSIFPGSWINGDFYVWIGHPDDHRAWGQLVDARRALGNPPAGASEAALAQAHEEMLVAEGSDWFWWYGDDHSSEHDAAFDELFRRHVRNVYRSLDLPVPEELLVTNITTQPASVEILPPTGRIAPVIDGAETSYFEWIGAGFVDTAGSEGAMHQAAGRDARIASIEFGCDLTYLYVRLNSPKPLWPALEGGLTLVVKFLTPAGRRIAIGAKGRAELAERGDDDVWRPVPAADLKAVIGAIAEIQIPLETLAHEGAETLSFVIAVARGEDEIAYYPQQRPIELALGKSGGLGRSWTA